MLIWHDMRKQERSQPTDGEYSDWKEAIAEYCNHQCVYCCIGDARYGGIDNFHVEHYRPYKHFKHLQNDISNLYLSCAICNRFKSFDWPGEPADDHSVASYVSPQTTDFNTIFSHNGQHLIKGNFTASRYMVERLYLNRPQLVRERRLHVLSESVQRAGNDVLQIAEAIQSADREALDPDFSRAFAELAAAVVWCQSELHRIRDSSPYQLDDIRKPVEMVKKQNRDQRRAKKQSQRLHNESAKEGPKKKESPRSRKRADEV